MAVALAIHACSDHPGGQSAAPPAATPAVALEILDPVSLAHDGATPLHARLRRTSFDGATRVSAARLPPFVHMDPVDIAAGATELKLPFRVDAPEGVLGGRDSSTLRIEAPGLAATEIDVSTLVRGIGGTPDQTVVPYPLFKMANTANDAALASDDSLWLVGEVGNICTLARARPSGESDGAFGVAGVIPLTDQPPFDPPPAPHHCRFVAFAQGRLTVAGTTGSSAFVARYDVDGRLDAAFGVPRFETSEPIALGVDEKNETRVVLRATDANPGSLRVVRVAEDGRVLHTSAAVSLTGAPQAIVLPSGEARIVVAPDDAGAIAHGGFTAAGDIDSRYGPNGLRMETSPPDQRATAVAIGSRGDEAFMTVRFASSTALARDGADAAWEFPFGGTFVALDQTELGGVAATPSRQLVTAGRRMAPFPATATVRFTPEGKLDASFGGGISGSIYEFDQVYDAPKLFVQFDAVLVLGPGKGVLSRFWL